MTCRDCLEFIADYLDGKLPWGQKLSFEMHLALCSECRHYLDGYRKTISACQKSTLDTEPTEAMPEELIRAILATRQEQQP
jgi:anti-sigma factor RsiW